VLRTDSGGIVSLGRKIAQGAEGAIHEVIGQPALLAKLYLQPATPALIAKLSAIVRLPADRRPGIAAWPTTVLHQDGTAVGFLMAKAADRHELHVVSGNASRRQMLPHADYRFLVLTAANLSRAFAAVHAADHVIGDVNERGALIDGQARVTLIDVDSFQVEAAGRRHGCDVATPLYQPPELQAVASYRGLPRTRNHDAFGLAVLIFQLLFLARHPFAGRPLAGEGPELAEAIRRLQFAWGPDARRHNLAQPPSTLPLAALSESLGRFFIRAFGQAGIDHGRPNAAAWARELSRVLLVAPRTVGHAASGNLGWHGSICGVG